MLVNLFGSAFYLLILSGTYMVGLRMWQGWAFRLVGNLGWLVLGTYLGLWSVTLFETIFVCIDARSIVRWRNADKKEV